MVLKVSKASNRESTAEEKAPTENPAAGPLQDKAREVLGYVLFGLSTFLLLACASFAEPSPGKTLAWYSNNCGDAGFRAARWCLYTFGFGAYLGIFTLYVWSLALIARRALTIGPFRLAWFCSFLFSISAMLAHFQFVGTVRLPDDGGVVGWQIARFCEESLRFGPWGTKLVLVLVTLITFQLATDFILFSLIARVVRFVKARRAAAKALFESTGPMFRSLFSGGDPEIPLPHQNGLADPAAGEKAKKRRVKKSEIAVTDEDVVGFEGEVPGGAGAPAAPEAKKRAKAGDAAEKPAEKAADTAAEKVADKKPAAPAANGAAQPTAAEEEAGDVGDGETAPKKKIQAKIRFEPPKTAPARAAAFDEDHTQFVPPSAPMPRAERPEYHPPSLDLLEKSKPVPAKDFQQMIEHNIEVLETALASYKVEAEVVEIQKGPVITMFELNVAAGTRVDRVRSLEDDLAIRLKAQSVRIVAPIPGKSTIGIEVPNQIRETVRLRELIESETYKTSNLAIPIFLGKDAAGRPLIEDLARAPHLLVAGATGAGKSVCLNSIIMSVLFTRSPDQVKMILIDPKMVELSSFEAIPHLMCPVVRDMNRAAQILEWACQKMDERYQLLADAGARNIFAFNKIPEVELRERLEVPADDTTFEPRLPFIVIVVDELADLMMTAAKEVENSITRLAQKSRAVGIHVILATQRPSTNVVTGLIKANLPTRISFQVASKIDSRVVLDQNGAEKLLGSGDMLYLPPRTSMIVRSQGTFISDEEIKLVVAAVRTEAPNFARELMQKNQKSDANPYEVDDLYDAAARFVCETKRGSASLLQRKFGIGYTRASRLIDLMADDGILGEFRNSQAREVLLTLDEYEGRQAATQENGA